MPATSALIATPTATPDSIVGPAASTSERSVPSPTDTGTFEPRDAIGPADGDTVHIYQGPLVSTLCFARLSWPFELFTDSRPVYGEMVRLLDCDVKESPAIARSGADLVDDVIDQDV